LSWNGGGGKGIFFQRIVFLTGFSLILFFIAYELLETPSKGFLVIRIIDFKEKNNEFSLALFLSNNSSEKREGHLILLIGYEDSRVSENTTYYYFTDFNTLSFSVITLKPGEGKRLDVKLPRDPEAKRIVVIYYCCSNSIAQTGYHNPILLRRDDTVWVQTWIG